MCAFCAYRWASDFLFYSFSGFRRWRLGKRVPIRRRPVKIPARRVPLELMLFETRESPTSFSVYGSALLGNLDSLLPSPEDTTPALTPTRPDQLRIVMPADLASLGTTLALSPESTGSDSA